MITEEVSYIVTDIEADGPDPGQNSMLSVASASIGVGGKELGRFQVNLSLLDGAVADLGTTIWWQENPEAYEKATMNPMPPAKAIGDWADWVRRQPGAPVFVSHPLSFDGLWMDYYTQRFLGQRLFWRPRSPGLFLGAGVDLASMVMAATGWEYPKCTRDNYPDAWLGHHPHTHDAMQDVMGYAHLFHMLRTGQIGRLSQL